MKSIRRFLARTLVVLGWVLVLLGVIALFLGAFSIWTNTQTGAQTLLDFSLFAGKSWSYLGWWAVALGAISIVLGYAVDAKAARKSMTRVADAVHGAAKGAGRVVWSAVEGITSSTPVWVWLAVAVVAVALIANGDNES